LRALHGPTFLGRVQTFTASKKFEENLKKKKENLALKTYFLISNTWLATAQAIILANKIVGVSLATAVDKRLTGFF
jgi:hypothetical protein